MRSFILLLFIGYATFLTGQSEKYASYPESPVFAQVGVGIFPHFEFFNTEISAAAGYRLTHNLGLGMEYRLTTSSGPSFGDAASLLGLRLRRQFWNGWGYSLGGGIVLDASRGSDNFDMYEYVSGGQYLAVDVDYQLRWGLTVGVYGTAAWGHRHESLLYNLDTEIYEPTGNITPYGFGGVGVKLGYAFPMRGKRAAGEQKQGVE